MNRAELLEFLKYLPVEKPLLLRGPSGIGKSSLVRQFARQTLNKKPLTIFPAEMEPTDLVGLPYIEDGKTKFAQPHWWPHPDSKTILFIEEVDRCNEQMFPVVMQLIENRTAGGRELPAHCRVIAACNGVRFLVNDLDQGIMRRFAVVDYQPTVAEWLTWAEQNQVHTDLVEYIRATPEALDTPQHLVGKPNIQIPCRATWHDASNWMISAKSAENPGVGLLEALTTFVGKQAAETFVGWKSSGKRVLRADDVFEGSLDPKKVSILQAAHIAEQVAKTFMQKHPESRTRALDFYLAVGDEAFVGLFKQLPKEATQDVSGHPKARALVKSLMQLVK